MIALASAAFYFVTVFTTSEVFTVSPPYPTLAECEAGAAFVETEAQDSTTSYCFSQGVLHKEGS